MAVIAAILVVAGLLAGLSMLRVSYLDEAREDSIEDAAAELDVVSADLRSAETQLVELRALTELLNDRLRGHAAADRDALKKVDGAVRRKLQEQADLIEMLRKKLRASRPHVS